MSVLKRKKFPRPAGAKKLSMADKAALKSIFNEQNEYSGYISGGGVGACENEEEGEEQFDENENDDGDDSDKKKGEGSNDYDDMEEEFKPVLFKLNFLRAISIVNKQEDEEVDLESFFMNFKDDDEDDDGDDEKSEESKITTEDNGDDDDDEDDEYERAKKRGRNNF